MNNKINIKLLPHAPGVYIMRDTAAKIIYIGKANDLRKRVSSYFKGIPDFKTRGIINSLRHIDFILRKSERDALILERELIRNYQPHYNAMWRDDKSYPMLKLTLKEDFPRLLITRRKVKDGSEYFGPYPNATALNSLVKWMQKIFRWRTCKLEISKNKLPPERKVKTCLYLHTGRCPGPCVGKITPEEYRRNILGVKLFLRGRYKNLIKHWEKEMKEASAELKYEKAAELRNRIAALESINEKVTFKEVKPEDLSGPLGITSDLEELKEKLGLPKLPAVMECFDISNISGTDSVGSMVRFQNAEPDKTNYRRFKIKGVQGTDDFAMINEVVSRRYSRLKQQDGQMPDLVVIDGGKGQLAAASSALSDLKLKIPLISLAKREEEIFVPGKSESVRLPRDSRGLQILQHLRNEAHRFAISFHRLRRKKRMQTQG
jgi:excinuclease ABC subunit C